MLKSKLPTLIKRCVCIVCTTWQWDIRQAVRDWWSWTFAFWTKMWFQGQYGRVRRQELCISWRMWRTVRRWRSSFLFLSTYYCTCSVYNTTTSSTRPSWSITGWYRHCLNLKHKKKLYKTNISQQNLQQQVNERKHLTILHMKRVTYAK